MNRIPEIAKEDIRFRNSAVGLLDIAMGAALIIIGTAFLFDTIAISSSFFIVIFMLVLILKQKVVYPRIGYVQHKGMKDKTRNLFTITLIIGIVMLIGATFVYLKVARGQNSQMMRELAQNWGSLILGAVFSLVIALIGKTYGIKRFYIYAGLILCLFTAIQFIPYEYIVPVAFSSGGVAVSAIGVYLFIKFIRNYPRLDGNADE